MLDLKTDPVVTTASVSPPAAVLDHEASADSGAILNVLSEPSEAVGRWWENAETGTRGMVTAFVPREEDGSACFTFTTTRESYDGISLYQGLVCEDRGGALRMRELVQE